MATAARRQQPHPGRRRRGERGTCCPRDFLRVSLFIEQSAVDLEALTGLLERYDLSSRAVSVPNWPKGGRRDPTPNPS